ncbi:Tetrathionate sensor histidine kinase TtrS [compost metagenome]
MSVDSGIPEIVIGDNGVTRRTEGTGLGLAICKRIVELMHGEIALAADDGTSTGTTIHFTAEFGIHK